MTGIYLFAIAYSPGEGPVPFTYSAECYPLYVRDIGMSIATAVTWGFNFCVTMSLPNMKRNFQASGMTGFYSAWNLIGFFLVLLYITLLDSTPPGPADRVALALCPRQKAGLWRSWTGFFQFQRGCICIMASSKPFTP